MRIRIPFAGSWPSAVKLMLAIILPAASSACGLAPAHQSAAEPPMLAPSTLHGMRSALQLIHAAFGSQELAFQSVVDVKSTQLTVVGLSAEGQRLFSLRYDGRTLQSDLSPQVPDRLNPRQVLTDLQLAMWPLHTLQESLAGSGWEISETGSSTRRLRYAGRLVSEVHYADADPWKGRLWISNFEHDYSLAIESRPLQ